MSNEQIDALVCLGPGELQIEVRPWPRLTEREVLVRPRRIGICGTDFHIYEGKHPFLTYPRVMGHELAVEVLDAPRGSSAKIGGLYVVNPYFSCGSCIACRSGKPNCCVSISVLGVHEDGGMRSMFALPERNLVAADGLSADECAMAEFLSIGAHAVRRGAVKPGDRALVVGAGPIGLGVALFAADAGGQVSVMDLDANRLAAATSLLDVQPLQGGESALTSVKVATRGEGFEVVFDATGNAKSIEAGFEYVAPGGRYVLVSVVKETISFNDPVFHAKEMTLLASRNATIEDFDMVIAGIKAGRMPVDKIITHRTTLRNALHDLPRWAKEKDGLVKAVVEIEDRSAEMRV